MLGPMIVQLQPSTDLCLCNALRVCAWLATQGVQRPTLRGRCRTSGGRRRASSGCLVRGPCQARARAMTCGAARPQ